jgi:uncharacterized protein with ParB-like and HNH nuclease domain
MDNKSDELIDLDAAEDDSSDEQSDILDEASDDDTVPLEHFNITSYGADYDVEGMVKRLQRQDIYIPPFQRDYVWTLQMASRFVESLLLGLPVPGVFFVREPESNRQIVIDGQQRLKTLQFFYEGFFNPKADSKTKRVFKLVGVQCQLEGRTYETLETQDRIELNDSIIHATIVKQESPENDDTSMYHIFERLNNAGRKLLPQEMRSAIYHGALIDTIKSLNEVEAWREIFGAKHKRLKDQELILRFLALYFKYSEYERPMEEFLSKFAKGNQNPSEAFIASCDRAFTTTINAVHKAVGSKAFRTGNVLNAAIFDSVMVGLALKLKNTVSLDSKVIQEAYEHLLKDTIYQNLVKQHTSDTSNVETRIGKSIDTFSGL